MVTAVLVAALLHLALPANYRLRPPWLFLVVTGVLLAVLVIGDPGRIDRRRTWLRAVTTVLIAFVTLANLYAAGRLVSDILTSNKLFANNAVGLLATGGVVWATNVIAFALWYWDLDCGGAAARARSPFAQRVLPRHNRAPGRRLRPPTGPEDDGKVTSRVPSEGRDLAPVDAKAARRLTTELQQAMRLANQALAHLADRVHAAHQGRVWIALGYPGWGAYAEAELQMSRALPRHRHHLGLRPVPARPARRRRPR